MEIKPIHIAAYSRTGHTRAAAEQLAELLSPWASLEHIEPMHRTHGLFGYLRAGRAAMKQLSWPIEEPRPFEEGRRCLVIGTPIWAGRLPPPVRSYLKQVSGGYAHLAALIAHGGTNPSRVIASIAETSGLPVDARVALSDADRAQGAVADKLSQFADTLRGII
jgi:hypothetical protein